MLFRIETSINIICFSKCSFGKRVVEKGQFEKREVGKSDMNLKRLKLVSSGRSMKVRVEVGKYGLKLESTTEVGK